GRDRRAVLDGRVGLTVVAALAGDRVVVGIAAVRGDPLERAHGARRERDGTVRPVAVDRDGAAGEGRVVVAVRVARAVRAEDDVPARARGRARQGRAVTDRATDDNTGLVGRGRDRGVVLELGVRERAGDVTVVGHG